MYAAPMRRILLITSLLCGCPAPTRSGDGAPTPSVKMSVSPTGATRGPFVLPAGSNTRFAKQLERIHVFEADDRPPTADDAAVVEAVRELGQAQAHKPLSRVETTVLFALFRRLRAHTRKAKNLGFYRVLKHTLVAVADPSWEPELIRMLDVPVASLQRKHFKPMMDQVFWQGTAAEVLGQLRSERAVKPLIKMVLSPLKKHIVASSLLALVRIGKPAVNLAVQLLEGGAPDLVLYATAELRRAAEQDPSSLDSDARAKRVHMEQAVLILGHLGTDAAKAPLLAAAKSESQWLRQLAAEQLHRLPQDSMVLDAFKRVYAETEVGDKLPDGDDLAGDDNAKMRLLQSAWPFFDPAMVGFVMADAGKLTGPESDMREVQGAVLDYALRAADKQLWPQVGRMSADITAMLRGADLKRRNNAYAGAKALLDRCGEVASCYATALEGVGPNQMPALRSAHRLAILADAEQVPLMVKHALATKNHFVRAVLAAAILSRLPAGEVAIATALESAYNKSKTARDEPRTAALSSLQPVVAVLRARAATKE